jgi:hypothetical protein
MNEQSNDDEEQVTIGHSLTSGFQKSKRYFGHGIVVLNEIKEQVKGPTLNYPLFQEIC